MPACPVELCRKGLSALLCRGQAGPVLGHLCRSVLFLLVPSTGRASRWFVHYCASCAGTVHRPVRGSVDVCGMGRLVPHEGHTWEQFVPQHTRPVLRERRTSGQAHAQPSPGLVLPQPHPHTQVSSQGGAWPGGPASDFPQSFSSTLLGPPPNPRDERGLTLSAVFPARSSLWI